MLRGEAVAGGDIHDIVHGDQQAEEWDFVFRMADAVAAAVEHDEDGEATGCLCRPMSNVGFENDESRHVAVAHGNVLDRFSEDQVAEEALRSAIVHEASEGNGLVLSTC